VGSVLVDDSSYLTRRRFLVVLAGAAALPLIARWSGGGAPFGSAVTLPGCPRRAQNLLVERDGGGWRLTPTPVDSEGPVFHLNDSAQYIWRKADGRHTLDDLAADLSRTWGIAPSRAGGDVRSCVESLSRLGLISS
jgi:hypothetical protein